MVVKNFNGKEIKFKEFAVPESNNAKRTISTKIIECNNKLGEEIFKEKILKRLDLPDDSVNNDYWNHIVNTNINNDYWNLSNHFSINNYSL